MVEITGTEIDAALARGQERIETRPRVSAIRYDALNERMIVDLTNGCVFIFPPRLVQGLVHATEAELADVAILGAGFMLAWDGSDDQISIEGLMDGIFGTKAFMQRELSRKAGSTKSPAKSEAARRNGARGGRPRKTA